MEHLLSSWVINCDQQREYTLSSKLTDQIWSVARSDKKFGEKYGWTYKGALENFKHNTFTRIESEPTYREIQVWYEYIWGNVEALPFLTGQGNGLLGHYMSPNLYYTH